METTLNDKPRMDGVFFINWALGPFFIFRLMHKAPETLISMVRNVVEGMDYELVGVEYISRNKGGNLLRVYIDTEGGVVMEDCAAVSHQLSGVLDVEDPIQGEYSLEISSPGMDRPLFELAQFERFIGHAVRVKMLQGITGRRNFKGTIEAVDANDVVIKVEDEVFHLPFNDIDSARLIPEF